MPRPTRTTPYGKTETGDRVLLARVLGNFGSQEDLADRAGLGRLEVQALESGRTKGNSRQVTDALARAFGRPPGHFQAYLDGAYGPPTESAARAFLAGEAPPSHSDGASTSDIYLEALWILAQRSPGRDFTGAARSLLATENPQGLSANALADLIASLDADARNRSVGVRELTEEGKARRPPPKRRR